MALRRTASSAGDEENAYIVSLAPVSAPDEPPVLPLSPQPARTNVATLSRARVLWNIVVSLGGGAGARAANDERRGEQLGGRRGVTAREQRADGRLADGFDGLAD